MTTRQYVHYTNGQTVLNALKSITAKRPNPILQAGLEALASALAEIATDAASQAEPITGKTADRNHVFDVAAQSTDAIARLTLGYALKHELPALAGRVNVPFSQLSRGRLARRLQLMQQVHDAAAEFVESLAEVNVTAAMLEEDQAKVDAAKAVLTLPRSTIAARRVATERVARGVRTLQRLLRYQLDPQVDLLKATDPESYAFYRAARLVIDRGSRRSAPETEGSSAPTAVALAAPVAPEALQAAA